VVSILLKKKYLQHLSELPELSFWFVVFAMIFPPVLSVVIQTQNESFNFNEAMASFSWKLSDARAN
jgi:hypothetical protein